jgi:hypothetical protein
VPINRTRKALLALVAVLQFLGSACSDAVIPDAALIGTWTVAQESFELLPVQVRANAVTLTLHSDGTFEGNVLAEMVSNEPEGRNRAIHCSGEWRRDNTLGDQRIGLRVLEVRGPHSLRLPFRTDLWLTTSRDGTRLHYYRGDPDERVMFVFAKVAA